jgi:hypothetical protein
MSLHTMSLEQYFEKLRREREYLEGQIAKVPRSGPIRAQLQEALSLSHDTERALSGGDAVGAAQARDLLHITLFHAKHFQWQPLMKDGTELAPFRKSSNAGRKNLAAKRDALRTQADERAIAAFSRWCKSPVRREVLAKLSTAERLRKYIRVARPPDRVRRRLNAMIKDGTLK